MSPDNAGRDPVTVLVTGAGSELAFGIIKACRLSQVPLRVIGCDADADALGLHWSDRAAVVPDCRHDPDGYVAALHELVDRERVRAILPTPDAELELLPRYRDEFRTAHRCWLMVNPPAEMARFNDKWLAYKWYVEHSLPTPRTARADVPAECDALLAGVDFPVVLKPRRGGGSRTLFVVHDRAELKRCLPLVPNPLVQECVGTDDQEYTAGTFRTLGEEVHTIVLRRRLKFGLTYKAEVVTDNDLHGACRTIIRNTNLEGVNNIQFRLSTAGPRILEINPRFSGTTGIRARFGFNEPEMVVRQYVLGEEVSPPVVRPGRVLRYLHEDYFPAHAVEEVLSPCH